MKILIFGATGAAGGSILRVALASPSVDQVRAITRRTLGITHPKLREIRHADFVDYAALTGEFSGVEACLFCLGISVTQVSEESAYRRITHDFAIAAARTLKQSSPGAAFHYISGRSTRPDSRMMWARVKAETERELMDLVGAVCWRPGFIDTPPSASEPRAYRWLKPVFRLLKPFRNLYVSGDDLGRAMLQTTVDGVRARVIENAEIREIAARARV
jgi:uncharacterized protein YbjT (DUF2867 family)